METIGDYAFSRCASLKEIQYGGTMAQWNAVRGGLIAMDIRCTDGYIEFPKYLRMDQWGSGMRLTGYTGALPANLVIPNGITLIDRGAFKGCTSLASVTIPESVKEIDKDAFEGCTSLKEIQFGGTVAQWKAIKELYGIPASFIRCSDGSLGVKDVPKYLKMYRTGISGYNEDDLPDNLVIPEGVTYIGNEAFNGCTSLASVAIPGSVKEIGGGGYGAFSGCTSLKSVTLAEGVEKIDLWAFLNCTSLASVTISEGGRQSATRRSRAAHRLRA